MFHTCAEDKPMFAVMTIFHGFAQGNFRDLVLIDSVLKLPGDKLPATHVNAFHIQEVLCLFWDQRGKEALRDQAVESCHACNVKTHIREDTVVRDVPLSKSPRCCCQPNNL